MSDTPKTDAVVQRWHLMQLDVVPAEHARAQERRIADLQSAIRNITCRLLPHESGMDMRFTRVDVERLEALLS